MAPRSQLAQHHSQLYEQLLKLAKSAKESGDTPHDVVEVTRILSQEAVDEQLECGQCKQNIMHEH